jgi:hypothetical protein
VKSNAKYSTRALLEEDRGEEKTVGEGPAES